MELTITDLVTLDDVTKPVIKTTEIHDTGTDVIQQGASAHVNTLLDPEVSTPTIRGLQDYPEKVKVLGHDVKHMLLATDMGIIRLLAETAKMLQIAGIDGMSDEEIVAKVAYTRPSENLDKESLAKRTNLIAELRAIMGDLDEQVLLAEALKAYIFQGQALPVPESFTPAKPGCYIDWDGTLMQEDGFDTDGLEYAREYAQAYNVPLIVWSGGDITKIQSELIKMDITDLQVVSKGDHYAQEVLIAMDDETEGQMMERYGIKVGTFVSIPHRSSERTNVSAENMNSLDPTSFPRGIFQTVEEARAFQSEILAIINVRLQFSLVEELEKKLDIALQYDLMPEIENRDAFLSKLSEYMPIWNMKGTRMVITVAEKCNLGKVFVENYLQGHGFERVLQDLLKELSGPNRHTNGGFPSYAIDEKVNAQWSAELDDLEYGLSVAKKYGIDIGEYNREKIMYHIVKSGRYIGSLPLMERCFKIQRTYGLPLEYYKKTPKSYIAEYYANCIKSTYEEQRADCIALKLLRELLQVVKSLGETIELDQYYSGEELKQPEVTKDILEEYKEIIRFTTRR